MFYHARCLSPNAEAYDIVCFTTQVASQVSDILCFTTQKASEDHDMLCFTITIKRGHIRAQEPPGKKTKNELIFGSSKMSVSLGSGANFKKSQKTRFQKCANG